MEENSKKVQRLKLAQKLAKESKLVKDESMKVLAEFEAIEKEELLTIIQSSDNENLKSLH